MTCEEFGAIFDRFRAGTDPTGTELWAGMAHLDGCESCMGWLEERGARMRAAGRSYVGTPRLEHLTGLFDRRRRDPEARA